MAFTVKCNISCVTISKTKKCSLWCGLVHWSGHTKEQRADIGHIVHIPYQKEDVKCGEFTMSTTAPHTGFDFLQWEIILLTFYGDRE
jgi:hypothetical protein